MTTDHLTNLLLSNDPTPLTPDDRALLIAALAELAIAQTLVAKQSMLLDSFQADHATIESTLRDSLASLTSSATASDVSPFDYTAANQARRDLAAKLAHATTLRSIVTLALGAVRTIART